MLKQSHTLLVSLVHFVFQTDGKPDTITLESIDYDHGANGVAEAVVRDGRRRMRVVVFALRTHD